MVELDELAADIGADPARLAILRAELHGVEGLRCAALWSPDTLRRLRLLVVLDERRHSNKSWDVQLSGVRQAARHLDLAIDVKPASSWDWTFHGVLQSSHRAASAAALQGHHRADQLSGSSRPAIFHALVADRAGDEFRHQPGWLAAATVSPDRDLRDQARAAYARLSDEAADALALLGE